MDNNSALIERATELGKLLRNTCNGCNPTPCCEFETLGDEAADFIDELASAYTRINDFERSQCYGLLAKLNEAQRRERAAMKDVPHWCYTCAHRPDGGKGQCAMGCKVNGEYINESQLCNWKWRGPQEAEEVGR